MHGVCCVCMVCVVGACCVSDGHVGVCCVCVVCVFVAFNCAVGDFYINT